MPVVTNGFSYHSAEPSRPSDEGFVTLKSLAEESEGNYDYDDKEDVARADRLIFRDSKYKETALNRLNTMRKNRELCDVVLFVQNRELFAHKAVLASVSPYLYDLFTASVHSAQSSTTDGPGQDRSYFEFNDIDFGSFEALVNYAYTSCLEADEDQVKNLYRLAYKMQMHSCAKACAKYLASRLDPYSCIGIRACANSSNDQLLAARVDDYIQQNFTLIHLRSQEFAALPHVKIEIVLSEDGHEMLSYQIRDERQLMDLVVEWLEIFRFSLPEFVEFRMEQITDKVHMLYLDDDLSLHDCLDASDSSSVGSCELIKDYKRNSKKTSVGGVVPSTKMRGRMGSNPKIARMSSSESLASTVEEIAWKTIAISKLSDYNYLGLAVLNRQLAVLSIHLNEKATRPISTNGENIRLSPSAELLEDFSPLATMAAPRCSVGAVALNGKLVVCGGYDRGECLNLVQAYNPPPSNQWEDMPSMLKARGRFDAAVVNGSIICVGGSDGSNDLPCCECFDAEKSRWKMIAKLPIGLSNTGCVAVDDSCFSVGGWNGQAPVRTCYRYIPEENVWEAITPLPEARYQVACTTYAGKVLAVGGCNGWDCLCTVIQYDPVANLWSDLPDMTVPRRGCGAAILNNKLVVAGGSDGILPALNSVEIYDFNTKKWTKGPCLSTPRANVRLVTLGNQIYAVGGFNGKNFLNTIEYLEIGSDEWRTGMAASILSMLNDEEAQN